MSHPSESWSQQVIEDVAHAVRERTHALSETSHVEADAEAAAESLLAELDCDGLAAWTPPEDCSEDDYIAAVRYELRAYAPCAVRS